MSNVKVNGNTYNGVTSVKLMKSDGSGYAEYKEGAEATASEISVLIADGAIGDIENDAGTPILSWMNGGKYGTVSFPYATSAKGGVNSCYFDNLLLPNATDISAHAGNGPTQYRMTGGFQNCKITGTLDLSSLATSQNNAVIFTGSDIGTLKLGNYCPNANAWAATFTNLILNGLTDALATNQYFYGYFKSATITNLYVPAAVMDAVQAKITDGTLTKITNLYSIDEWED